VHILDGSFGRFALARAVGNSLGFMTRCQVRTARTGQFILVEQSSQATV
jgi:hypothetical protein